MRHHPLNNLLQKVASALFQQPAHLVLMLNLCMLSGQLHALATDKDQPIELMADSAEVDESKGLSIYKGNVDLTQGSIRVWADQVNVEHRGKKPNKITAIGSPARFQQEAEDGLIKARAKRADYVVNSEILTLTGDAVLIQGKDQVKNDRIIYDRVRHKIRAGEAAEGKQRVHITIQPRE